tara:strand:+ start:276 stop:1127 length:852 start_codon:yes stop_codon:yes gene_type:complete
MMKTLLRTTFLASTLVFLAGTASGQNIPIDFEATGNGATWTWTVFENTATPPPLEIIDNPDKSGINTSCTVAKFTALQAGNPWAGCESLHGADLGAYTLDATNSTISIMVWKSVISDVGIKLVTPSTAALPELKIPNTLINQWELITFDFSVYIGQGVYAVEMVDQIVIFPDFDLGGRTQDNICYFDQVYGDGTATSCSGVSISETEKMSFNLFPNPATQSFTIESESSIEEVTVYNLMGAVVSKIQTSENLVIIDIAEFLGGVYFVEANINGQLIRRKLIKE